MAENSGIGNEALKALIQQMIDKSSSGGGLSINEVYPVGSIYMSVNNVSPATFIGGTWEALDEGRVLIGAGSAHPAGETGGEEDVTLTAAEMPSHNHSGSASLSGNTSTVNGHNHDRGTMNITGSLQRSDTNFEIFPGLSSEMSQAGALSLISKSFNKSQSSSTGSSTSRPVGIKLNAADSWSGSTGSGGTHSHSISGIASLTTNNAGSGQSHNNMQPYLSVYMWKRTA